MIPQLNKLLKSTLCETLGMEVLECSEGRFVATMPVDSRTHQIVGLLHGGASVALAETVASFGGYYLVAPDGLIVVGQEINANHLRPVTSGKVKGVGEIIFQGQRSQVWGVSIYDDADRLVCVSRCTLAVIENNTNDSFRQLFVSSRQSRNT
jgi:1,4-dihydroxy-2-naphthoyl-CoA hydrolase